MHDSVTTLLNNSCGCYDCTARQLYLCSGQQMCGSVHPAISYLTDKKAREQASRGLLKMTIAINSSGIMNIVWYECMM